MITFSEIGAADRDHYDDCVTRLPGPDFRQTYGWGEVREADGWVPRRFIATRDGVAVGCAQVLIGSLPHLPFRLIQVPAGPLIDYHSPETVRAFADLLRRLGQEHRAVLARIEPQVLAGDEVAELNMAQAGLARSDLAWSFWNAPLEVLRIDLRGSEEESLSRLHPTQRRNTRRFGTRGNLIETTDDPEDFWQLHRLLQGLGARKGFMVRGRSYWQALWDQFMSRGRAVLLAAKRGGVPLAYMLNVYCGRTAFFLHGADAPESRSERPNDALYWASIREARRAGCSVFDLMGYVSDSHRRFKQSFGAELVRLTGYYELPVRPLPYRLFASMEKHILPRVVPCVARLGGRRSAEVPRDDGAG